MIRRPVPRATTMRSTGRRGERRPGYSSLESLVALLEFVLLALERSRIAIPAPHLDSPREPMAVEIAVVAELQFAGVTIGLREHFKRDQAAIAGVEHQVAVDIVVRGFQNVAQAFVPGDGHGSQI